MSKNWNLFVTVMLLEDTPAVLFHSEHSAKITGKNTHWTTGQKPQLIKNGRRLERNTANNVPFVVPGPSTSSSSSSSPSSPKSLPQEAPIPTLHPASSRSESMSEEVRGDSSHGPTETENPNKNDDEEVRGDPFA